MVVLSRTVHVELLHDNFENIELLNHQILQKLFILLVSDVIKYRLSHSNLYVTLIYLV